MKRDKGICDCWLDKGVQRTAKGEYRCVACGYDVSITFTFLSQRNDGLADRLIEKGQLNVGH